MNFSRGVEGPLSHLWKFRRGRVGVSTLQKWKIQRGGWGLLSEIPSVVGVWIFSGTTHCRVMLAFLPRFTFHISDDNLKVIPT